MALARVVVRGSQVIILDEATSSVVSYSHAFISKTRMGEGRRPDRSIRLTLHLDLPQDVETDQSIQETIRSEFTNQTILCIAHRLATVAYSDYVLVLDAGVVAESTLR